MKYEQTLYPARQSNQITKGYYNIVREMMSAGTTKAVAAAIVDPVTGKVSYHLLTVK